MYRRWRISVVVFARSIENLHCLLRNHLRKVFALELLCLLHVCRLFRTIAALICDNQLHITTPTQGSVPRQTSYRGQVVCFLSESVAVERGDWRIYDSWSGKAV